MLTVKEVKEHKLIQDNIINTIPEKCKCGWDIEISESLSEVQCSNPNCKFKVIARINKFLNYLDINDWSQAEIEQVVEKYDIVTPYQFMILSELTEELKVDVQNIKQKIENLSNLKSRKFHLWQIIKYAYIPYISSIAYELFGSYDNIEDAYNDIELEQVSFLVEKLGINNNDNSVIALLVFSKLLSIKEELQFGELQFDIIKYDLNPIKIVISTGISNFVNKYEYMEYLNNRYKDRFSFVLESKVSSDTVILINEDFFDSMKYRTAKRVNEEYIKEALENNLFKHSDIGKQRGKSEILRIGEKIAILTGQELIERLDSVLEEQENNIYNLLMTNNSEDELDELDDLSDEEVAELLGEDAKEENDSDINEDDDFYDELDDMSDEELEELFNDLEE